MSWVGRQTLRSRPKASWSGRTLWLIGGVGVTFSFWLTVHYKHQQEDVHNIEMYEKAYGPKWQEVLDRRKGIVRVVKRRKRNPVAPIPPHANLTPQEVLEEAGLRSERPPVVHPEAVLDPLGDLKGMRVAQLCAGTGDFMMEFSNRVGEAGSALFVDLSPPFIHHMFQLKQNGGFKNVRVQAFSFQGQYFFKDALQTDLLDLVFSCDAWDELGIDTVVQSGWRALKPGGRLVVLEKMNDSDQCSLEVWKPFEMRGFVSLPSLTPLDGYVYRIFEKPLSSAPPAEPTATEKAVALWYSIPERYVAMRTRLKKEFKPEFQDD